MKKTTKREAFPKSRPRALKRQAGRTDVSRTPLAVLARGPAPTRSLDRRVRERLTRALGKFAEGIERLSVRFEDVNGPRGGVDVACRVKVVLSGLPSVIVEERATTEQLALGKVAKAVRRAVVRRQERAGKVRRTKRRGSARTAPDAIPTPEEGGDAGSLIGRRVGRGSANLRAVLRRPEKLRRDVPVDTAQAGVSATDRKAGGIATARRNSRATAPRATATLEDSRQERPSRKPTRRSANRAKGGTQLEKRAVARTTAASTRAARARARTRGTARTGD